MADMSAVQSNSVDSVFSSYNIERLYPHEEEISLLEFYRVQDSEGFCVTRCPDLQTVWTILAQNKLLDPVYIFQSVGLHQSMFSMDIGQVWHKAIFTWPTGQALLRRLYQPLFMKQGSTVATIKRPHCFDLWAIAYKEPAFDSEIQSLVKAHFPVA